MFFRGFALLRRKLLIEGIPASTVRSAALGLVEVSGTATGPYSVISPLSKTECYFYRAILPRHGDCQETLCVPFFPDDGTGTLLIDPRGAETDDTFFLATALRRARSTNIASVQTTGCS